MARAADDRTTVLLHFAMKHALFAGLICSALAMAAVSALAQPKATPPSGCLVAQFKALALSQSDQVQRTQQAQDWLLKNVARCTPEQLSAIKNNSAAWLGTALTPPLWGLIEGAIEARISGNPALMGQLYESVGKEGTATVVTHQNPPPRPPVVRPMDNRGILAGSVVQGQISGGNSSIINQSNQAVQSPNAVQSMPANMNPPVPQGQSAQPAVR